MPSGVAWETFGLANGVESYAEMRERLGDLRRRGPRQDVVSWVVLSELEILQEAAYLDAARDWKRNTVRGEYFDLTEGEGARVWAELAVVAPPSFRDEYAAEHSRRVWAPAAVPASARTRRPSSDGDGRVRAPLRGDGRENTSRPGCRPYPTLPFH